MQEGPQFAKPKACKVNIGFPYGIGVPPFYKTKKFVIRELRPCAPRLAGWVACFPECKFLSVNLSHTHTSLHLTPLLPGLLQNTSGAGAESGLPGAV